MEPSAMREVFVEVPDVSWEEIGGYRQLSKNCRKLWNGL
jgi:SpoVK/Ycf46/Vps4 family AAA+-type ATPase